MEAISHPLMEEKIWYEKWRCEDAETEFHQKKGGCCEAGGCGEASEKRSCSSSANTTLASEIARAREQIKKSLNSEETAQVDEKLGGRIDALEAENTDLRKVTQDLQAVVKRLESRITALEQSASTTPVVAPAQVEKNDEVKDNKEEDEDDDEFDMFGSDSEEDDEEKERIKEERIKAYTAKKANKTQVIAKSNLILDVKPWDDETDMAELEKSVRTIQTEGLLWGASKFVPVGYGIKKLQISAVIVDDLVSTDFLEEEITGFTELIQSMDIAAFNKI